MVMRAGVASGFPGRRGEVLLADQAELVRLVEPVVEAQGLALVRVSLQGGRRSATLQIMAEDPDTGQLTLDQCAELSRALDPVLEEADPIPEEYRLEVSSPGIDRPLTRPADWDRWAGHRARVTLDSQHDGRKRFDGQVLGLDGADVRLDVPGLGETRLPLAAIQTAKLVLTDELIRATKPLSTEGADSIVKDRR